MYKTPITQAMVFYVFHGQHLCALARGGGVRMRAMTSLGAGLWAWLEIVIQ